jgi:hypothetical protein
MAALRNLLATTILAASADMTSAIERDAWRMLHMTRAKISHYARRGEQGFLPLRI